MGETIQEEIGLVKIFSELRDFRQAKQKQLNDIKGGIGKTNKRIEEAEDSRSRNQNKIHGR